MSHAPRWHRVLRGVAGGALVVVGIAFCFLPGPGLLGIAFGLALLAGMWPRLAHTMDRGEPRLRVWSHKALHEWKQLPKRTRALIGTAAGVFAGLIFVVLWDAIW